MAVKFRIVSGLLLSLMLSSSTTCMADTLSPDASTAGAPVRQPLTAGVQKVELTLEQLRDVGLDLKQVMSSSRHLYDEVNIQPVSIITEPEVIGRGTVINIPIATRSAGPPAQPNKARVDQAMAMMTPIINQFKRGADAFVSKERELAVAPELSDKLAPLLQDWIADANKISGELQTLQPLTQGPTYDNAAISSVCQQMQDTAKNMDKVRSKAFKILKKGR